MKRVFFKLVDDFILELYILNDKFKIYMNVKKWEKKLIWNILIDDNNSNDNLEFGVIILILKLNDKIEDELLFKKFKRNFISIIKINFEFVLEVGFEIYLNKKRIEYNSGLFVKNLLDDRIYIVNENEVRLKIEFNSKRSFEYYGWNYIINGRNIIYGDKIFLNDW